jgi:phage tail-like protein
MAAKPELKDPLVAFAFGIEVQDKISGYFTEVSGLGSESEVVEHKIVNEDSKETIVQKIPGRLTWGDITLKRGVTDNLDVWEWRKEVEEGKVTEARKNGSIIAYSNDWTPVGRWDFVNAWPSKVDGPAPAADSTDYLIEEMTLVHEGIERVS